MKNINCRKYESGKLPPCASLLGNDNPLIKDGRMVFRNFNRLFYFIGIQPKVGSKVSELFANIQISLPTYVTGLLIHQIECKKTVYNEGVSIHSNGNAILTPLQYNFDISLNNFLILLSINRIENNPGLFFVNNADATEDLLNFILADIDISFKTVDGN